jgi:hypothetical protein
VQCVATSSTGPYSTGPYFHEVYGYGNIHAGFQSIPSHAPCLPRHALSRAAFPLCPSKIEIPPSHSHLGSKRFSFSIFWISSCPGSSEERTSCFFWGALGPFTCGHPCE